MGRPTLERTVGADGMWISTSAEYDFLGRVWKSSDGDHTFTRSFLPNTSLVTSAFSDTGNLGLVYTHDTLGRVRTAARQEKGRQVTTTLRYDGRGAPLSETTQVAGGVPYEVSYVYADVGRLTSFQGKDPTQVWEDIFVDLEYSGSRVDAMRSGHEGGVGRHEQLYQQFEYIGGKQVANTIRFDPFGAASTFPPWQTRRLELDSVGRPMSRVHEDGSGNLIHRHDQWYGRDDKVIASVRGWSQNNGSGMLTHGQARAVGYAGTGWVSGVRELSSANANELTAWAQALTSEPTMPTEPTFLEKLQGTTS